MQRFKTYFSVCVLFVVLSCVYSPASADPSAPGETSHQNLELGQIDNTLLQYCYSEKEVLKYDISWTGGIKIGELHLEKTILPEIEHGHEIRAFVTTKGGAVNLIYPISDLHVTRVAGREKLPFHYEVWQEEGYSYTAHKTYEYDQDKYTVRYSRDDELKKVYELSGSVNNEFSSFFNSRIMPFIEDKPFLVPTFADKRRVEVAVFPVEREVLQNTLLGEVKTVKILPLMKFKGLYDKKGDTVIWYTDDHCRVPVKINSKIAIGSLTAILTEYHNPSCTIHTPVQEK